MQRRGVKIIGVRVPASRGGENITELLHERRWFHASPDSIPELIDRLRHLNKDASRPPSRWRGDISPAARDVPTKATAPPLEARPPVDRVTFSAFGPETVSPKQSFVLDIWAHTSAQDQAVAKEACALGRDRKIGIKSDVSITRGTDLAIVLELPKMRISDPVDTLVWHGDPANASFIIDTPDDLASGSYPGRAVITASGIPVAKLIFSVTVRDKSVSSVPTQLSASEIQPRRAFASYSSRDRFEVLGRVQGMHKVQPDLNVFVDVITLRAGQKWSETVAAHIRTDDIFFLFWSKHAAASKEVEKEWRMALEIRGLDYIDPVPLADPSEVKPPLELKALHFNDYYLAHLKLSREKERERKKVQSRWTIWGRS